MRVVEEPFLTREAVLSVLRPGQVTSGRPFRSMRERGCASPGIAIFTRSLHGHLDGKLWIYSSLNADAARAFRLRRFETAEQLAERAGKIERSRPARQIQAAIESIARRLPLDPCSEEAPTSLRRYVGLRLHGSPMDFDQGALAREWLAQSVAWLEESGSERDQLLEAVEALRLAAEKARARVADENDHSVNVFFGAITRLDEFGAELDSENGQVLWIPRLDLERQGLAALHRSVSIWQEALPGAGSLLFVMPAVALEPPDPGVGPSPWGPGFSEERAVFVQQIGERDAEWMKIGLAREPTAIPAAPLRVA
jgi:hypothetical protein